MSSWWAQIRDYLHFCKEIMGGIVQVVKNKDSAGITIG